MKFKEHLILLETSNTNKQFDKQFDIYWKKNHKKAVDFINNNHEFSLELGGHPDDSAKHRAIDLIHKLGIKRFENYIKQFEDAIDNTKEEYVFMTQFSLLEGVKYISKKFTTIDLLVKAMKSKGFNKDYKIIINDGVPVFMRNKQEKLIFLVFKSENNINNKIANEILNHVK